MEGSKSSPMDRKLAVHKKLQQVLNDELCPTEHNRLDIVHLFSRIC